MTYKPSHHDIAHLGHAEILTPKLDESVAFFENIMGLHESGRTENSVFLRGWGDYELHTLQLTRAKTSGIGHFAFRTRSAEVLDNMAEFLQANGVDGQWLEPGFGQGRTFRFASPDGHNLELYYDTEKFVPRNDQVPGFKNMPQRYSPHGIAPKRLDHINLLAQDVKACRIFFHEMLGLRITEQIVLDSGVEAGAWLTATLKSYDVAITRDHSNARGRFHHLTYAMDSREDVLRAADVLVESGTFIETGPHKHNIGQTFFLYFYEPGGNRFELCAGGYLIFDPDWQPVVWNEQERKKGQAWGLQTVSTFHTYGTPPVDEPESH